MGNFDVLMKEVLTWAKQNMNPVKDITFRCFERIRTDEELLSRYNELVAAQGKKPTARRNVNSRIARRIVVALNLESTKKKVSSKNAECLIKSYSILKH